MSKRALIVRIGVFSVITLAEVALGLAVARPIVGTAGVADMVASKSPGWLWPVFCIVGLSAIWLYAARSLVIRPVRFQRSYGALRDHVDPTVTTTRGAQGWYHDPYRIHQYRWISAGRPSALVKDGGLGSNDAPPDMPYVGSLVPEEPDDDAGTNGADLRRAGDRPQRTSWDVGEGASTWIN